MKRNGFTLVELIVVIALFSILAAIAVLQFSQMSRKGTIERQISEMYQEIANVQRQAMQTKNRYLITFNPQTMIINRLTGDVGVAGPVVLTKALPATITISAWPAPTGGNVTDIVFSTQGIDENPNVNSNPKSICVQSNVSPNVDSIVIAQTQISLGRILNQGAGCVTANIAKK